MRWIPLAMLVLIIRSSLAQDAIFDPDPKHLWNRLHRQLYTRTTADGEIYRQEDLEPTFVPRSKFLIDGPSHSQALTLLDEFLEENADSLISDPLKRAILQRDLWAVFATTADPFLERQPERRALQKRLAQVIRRVALTPREILDLPDNLAMAVEAGNVASDYEAEHPARPFLPGNLMQADGPWVLVGNRLRSDHLAAPIHVRATEGRAAFFLLLRLPAGREATENYLTMLREVGIGRDEIPQIPIGTQVALLRRAMLIDNAGRLRLTSLTESLQIRVYQQLKTPDVFEFSLHRKDLLSARASGLRPTSADTVSLFNLGVLSLEPRFQIDPLETMASRPPRIPTVVMRSCAVCHGGPGIYGFQSLFVDHFDRPPLAVTEVKEQVSPVIDRTGKTYAWGLLQGLWETGTAN